MSKKRFKQYLMLLTVVGLVAVAAGGGSGTFASFTAETTNAGNTFATGTLVLSNTVNAARHAVGQRRRGHERRARLRQGVQRARQEAGRHVPRRPDRSRTPDRSIPSALKFTAGTCADGNAVGETVARHRQPLRAQARRLHPGVRPTQTFTTRATAGTAAAQRRCAPSTNTKTLGTISGVSPITLTGPGLAHTTHRYFKIGLELPLAAGNNVQGRTADGRPDLAHRPVARTRRETKRRD